MQTHDLAELGVLKALPGRPGVGPSADGKGSNKTANGGQTSSGGKGSNQTASGGQNKKGTGGQAGQFGAGGRSDPTSGTSSRNTNNRQLKEARKGTMIFYSIVVSH